jgi:hypothetical protein
MGSAELAYLDDEAFAGEQKRSIGSTWIALEN